MRLRRKNALLICLLLNKQQRKILSDLLISHTLSMGLSHSDKSTENEKKKRIKSWGWVKKINVGNFCLSRPLARHCQTMSSEHSPVTSPTIQNQKNVWQNKPISDWFHVKKGQYSWETLTKQSFFFFLWVGLNGNYKFSRTTQLENTQINPKEARRTGKSIWYTYVFIQGSKHLADDALWEEGHGIPLHKGWGEDGAETFTRLSWKEENMGALTMLLPSHTAPGW